MFVYKNTTTIPNLSSIYQASKPDAYIFTTNIQSVLDLTGVAYTDLFVHKLTFDVNKVDIFKSLSIDTFISGVNDHIPTTGIHEFNLTKKYNTLVKFYKDWFMDSMYIMSPVQENITGSITYIVENISDVKDIYFLINNPNTTELYIRSDINYIPTTTSFLTNYKFTPNTSVKVILSGDLVNDVTLTTAIGNYKVKRNTFSVKAFPKNVTPANILYYGKYYSNQIRYNTLFEKGFTVSNNYIYLTE